MALRRSQIEILDWIISYTEEHQCGPMQRHVADGIGIANPYRSLSTLAIRGYLRQPYEGGPWLPVRRADGTPLELRLVEVERQAAG